MTDFGGDDPDTLDGRLAGIGRLIDTFNDDTDPDRRHHRRLAITRLLAQVKVDVDERIAELLDRLDVV